jgi:nucleoside-diphosphate-sugar epimerase
MVRGAIVVTGATGWVGRTLLGYLANALPSQEFDRRVVAFGSKTCSLSLSSRKEIPIHSLALLPAFAEQQTIDSLFHAAFLTPDRVIGVGIKRYCEINNLITRIVYDALLLRPTTRLVLFSSGAAPLVALADLHTVKPSPLHSYGLLKLQEEILLSSLSPTLVLRIYGLTGRYIRQPNRYALGDFLCSAIRNESIVINSPVKVVRSYVAALDLASFAWAWLQSSDPPHATPIDAVTETLDLLSLAETITTMYGLPSVKHKIDPYAMPDCYMASPQPFLCELQRYGLAPAPLEQQIRDTFSGLIMTPEPPPESP